MRGQGPKLLAVGICLLMLLCLMASAALPCESILWSTESICSADDVPWQNWIHYHDYAEITGTLAYLNATHPEVVDLFPIGLSRENRSIYCVKLTNESDVRSKPELFFVGYHHANEPITAELSLYFVVQAVTGFGTNETMTRMLNLAKVYVVVALNVDGFESSAGNEWQRKNSRPTDEDGDGQLDEDPPDDENGNGFIEGLVRSRFRYSDETIRWEGVDDDDDDRLNEDWIGGVDLNRNYGYAWSKQCDSGSNNPDSMRYKGPGPFSEPETQAIRDLTQQHDFRYAVSFHSGDQIVVYPWASIAEPTPDDELFREICSDVSALTDVTYMQEAEYLEASGILDDWMYANESVCPITCEIYRNVSALQFTPGPTADTLWRKGFFEYANPGVGSIEVVAKRWLPVFTYLTDRAMSEAYDIAVTEVAIQPTIIGQGRTAHVNVTVANQGISDEIFDVTVHVNASAVQTRRITLETGKSATVAFAWNTASWTIGHYIVGAEACSIPGETDVIDNTLIASTTVHVVVPGDANHNNVIDIFDAVTIIGKWVSTKGDLRYDLDVDWNNDGRIDMSDLVQCTSRYGQAYP